MKKFLIFLGVLLTSIVLLCSCNKSLKDSEEMAAYVQERTVSIVVNGDTVGSGFFIDENGTLVTCFHVIEDVFYTTENGPSASISVELSSGARYSLEHVVKFDPSYDLAILKIDTKSAKTPYFNIAKEESRTGSKVYACGAALGFVVGNFTDGLLSSVSHQYALAAAYISNAAISGGNSGGPLVNKNGEVIGIAAASYTYGENLNIFIKTSNLDKLRITGNKNLSDLIDWHNRETRDCLIKYIKNSYSGEFNNEFYYNSYIRSYHDKTGAECLYSSNVDRSNGKNSYDVTGYELRYYNTYRYSSDQYNNYIEYIKSEGYIYDNKLSSTKGGEVYIDIYYSEIDRSYIRFVNYTYNGQRFLQINMYIYE